MAFKKGQSGNPGGRSQDKAWAEAIRIAVNEPDDDGRKKLRRLADVIVARALAGDVTAMREIGDRLDGKPAQAIVGDDNAPPIQVVKWTIVDGDSGDSGPSGGEGI